MVWTRNAAEKLLSTSEFPLFEASRRDGIAPLSAKQLAAKRDRSRKLRDKYRDLFRRQRLTMRDRSGAKSGKSGVANLRTKEKAELFDDILKRFETRLKKVEADARKAASKKPARKTAAKKRATAKTAPPSPKRKRAGAAGRTARSANADPGFMSAAAKRTDVKRRQVKSGSVGIQAHVSSRGRRDQARKDGRG